ncbi:Uncharacterised protein [Vibrio cholerae]|nr:Uncharacterised protein [Vibrio cholerae]
MLAILKWKARWGSMPVIQAACIWSKSQKMSYHCKLR